MKVAETLIDWYKNECELISNQVGRHRRNLFRLIKVYFWLYGISLASILLWAILFFITADPDNYANGIVFIFYYIFLLLALASNNYLIYVFAKGKFATLETLERKGLILPLDASIFPSITADIFELAEKMGIERSRIVFWQLLSNGKYPSIEVDQLMRIHLVLPVHSILLYDKNPEEFKAIICHELAHVVQKDTEIFQVCNTYYSIMRTLFVPNAIFNIAITLYMFVRSYNSKEDLPDITYIIYLISIVIAIALIEFVNNGKKKVTEAREKSELLADTSSYIHYGDAILRLLKDNKDVENPGGYHPSPKKRLDNLTSLISTHNNNH